MQFQSNIRTSVVLWTVLGASACAVASAVGGCSSTSCDDTNSCVNGDTGDGSAEASSDTDAGGQVDGSGQGDATTNTDGGDADIDGNAADTGGGADSAPVDSGPVCSGSTSLLCSGQCVDPTQPTHCGTCANVCPVPTNGNGSATCTAPSSCGIACNAGFHACSGACNPDNSDPQIDPCAVNFPGAFVGPTGTDAATCTKAAPCKSISHAITVAKAAGTPHVFVCSSGTPYGENVVVGSSGDGVKVYGGLDCTSWAYNAANKTQVSPGSGYALAISGLTAGITFEDFAFTSASVSGAGQSSIAVFVASSQNVLLKRCSVKAGDAQDGTPGSGASNYTGAAAQDGSPSSGATGGQRGSATCTNGDASAGGTGGDGGPISSSGGDGAWKPTGSVTLGYDGKGGASGSPNCTNGDPGSNGAGGAPGPGASSNGMLDGSGWHPNGGNTGGFGKPGLGGGGGGGATGAAGGGGGGGGAGGCGGSSGNGGTGAGSSIGVLAYKSNVILDTCTVQTGKGGNGGTGANGQAGQAGGARATGACFGGYGGNGGGGGGGGGGAGGLSVGVVYSAGSTFSNQGNTISPGAAGNAGAGGAGGAPGSNALSSGNPGNPGANGTAGAPGLSQQTLSLP